MGLFMGNALVAATNHTSYALPEAETMAPTCDHGPAEVVYVLHRSSAQRNASVLSLPTNAGV